MSVFLLYKNFSYAKAFSLHWSVGAIMGYKYILQHTREEVKGLSVSSQVALCLP